MMNRELMMTTIRQNDLLGSCNPPIEKNEARARVLAHLISMPIQLKHLVIENFEWLLQIIEYVSDDFS